MTSDYPSDSETYVVAAAERLMEETMVRYDPSHDALHVQRVRKTALALARSLQHLKPDLLVVEVSALLHDILDKKYLSPDLTDAECQPLVYFKPFFDSVAPRLDLLATGQAAQISKIVENVSWSIERKLREDDMITDWHNSCIELHCVQDADRLDAIGAIGIMRCSAYSSATNRPLYAPPTYARYNDTAVAHFYDKLLKIKDCLKTEPGKKLGESRHEIMVNFLGALHADYDAIL